MEKSSVRIEMTITMAAWEDDAARAAIKRRVLHTAISTLLKEKGIGFERVIGWGEPVLRFAGMVGWVDDPKDGDRDPAQLAAQVEFMHWPAST